MKTVVFVLLLAAASCVGPAPSPCTECGGKCVDLETDSANCGDCNAVCTAGKRCTAGRCELSCPAGTTLCSGSCVDTQTSPLNCGACGTQCDSALACVAGSCAPACAAGSALCTAGNATYCAALATDNANCGACGTTCPAGRACASGRCEVSCPASMNLCGGADAGVCTSLQSDPVNCGACGSPCGPGQSCLSGRCFTAAPSSCDEYKRLFPAQGDGDVTLYFDGNPMRPYRATCVDMGTVPLTYVELGGDGGTNFSEYDNTFWGLPVQTIPSPSVLTRWSKVRLQNGSGQVAISDFRFATTTGENVPANIYKFAFATAWDCACGRSMASQGPQGNGPRYGVSQIDLLGTPFAIDPAVTWVGEGSGFQSSFSITAGGKLVSMNGGGCCGGVAPSHPVLGRTLKFRYSGWSCSAIHGARPTAPTGVYSLVDGSGPNATLAPLVYCDMTGAGGGWSLVMKVDGTSPTSPFGYDSPLWTSSAVLGPQVPDESRAEAKYAAFGATPFSEVRVISLDALGGPRAVSFSVPPEESMLSALSRNTPIATTTPRGPAAWTALGDGGTLQVACNREGLNQRGNNVSDDGARVRVGIIANNENDCVSPDSWAGVGGAVHAAGSVSVCSTFVDGGPQPIPSAGSWGAVTCFPGTARNSYFSTLWVR